jgi:hypothetical protein
MGMEHISEVLQRLEFVRTAYESPPEEMLGERLRRALAPNVQFHTQVWVDTAAGPFRLDMLLTLPTGRRIALEVDGREFHDLARDRWRTLFVLCAGRANVVHRVPASLIYINLVGVLAGLAQAEPQAFDTREAERWRQVSPDAWHLQAAGDDHDDLDGGGRFTGDGREFSSRAFLVDFRKSARDCSATALGPYMEFVRSTGLRDIDALQTAWEREHR